MRVAHIGAPVSNRNYTVGFRSQDTELTEHELPVEGEIPSWLTGSLVRNGPGLFEVGGRRLRHWFDGLAMLRRYTVADGGVTYTNRFLRSESYADAMAGRSTSQFATDDSPVSLRQLARLGLPESTDNANVHVAEIDGQLVAQTEVPQWVQFDRETLETTDEFAFQDTFDPHMSTAHLVADPVQGCHVGHALSFGRTHTYHLFKIPDGTRRREQIASIPTDRPAYVHSVGVSQDHIVLVETPLRIALRRLLSPRAEGFFDLLQWDNRETTLYVIDRKTGAVVTTIAAEPFFTFHTVNTYDDGEEVVLDLVVFADNSIVDDLTLAALAKDGFAAAPQGRLVRFRIGLDGTATAKRRYNGGIELPAVPPSVKTRQYRYAYGQATDREGANGLVKVDVERGTAQEWWETDCYVEEPCVVQRPGGIREDDGVVLAPALDVDSGESELLVFDAETLDLRARAFVPHHNPFGFHGRFFWE